jgi:hypothetical protein
MLDVGLLPHSRGLNQDKLECALYFFIVRKTTSEQEHTILITLYLAGAKNTNSFYLCCSNALTPCSAGPTGFALTRL